MTELELLQQMYEQKTLSLRDYLLNLKALKLQAELKLHEISTLIEKGESLLG